MLAANRTTRELLDTPSGPSIQKTAELQATRSIRRFVERMNGECGAAGLRVELDGPIIRCVVADTRRWQEHVAHHEARSSELDPLCKAKTAWLTTQARDGVVWWYDLPSLQGRYGEMMRKVTAIAIAHGPRLAGVPVVVGGDWEFNAWACPGGTAGDFIMVNLGFIQSYSYAAMFLEMLDEVRQAAERGQAHGLIASSMIWMAATALGYEPFQWDNLALPPSEYDRIWSNIQHPSERLEHAITLIDAFAMLHECGHIASGHTDVLRQWPPVDDLDAPGREDRMNRSRQFEYEADAFACQSLRALGGDGRQLVEPLLILFSMLRLCEDNRTSRSHLTMSHPMATERLRACLVALGQDGDAGCRLLDRLGELIVTASRRRLEWQASPQCAEPRRSQAGR